MLCWVLHMTLLLLFLFQNSHSQVFFFFLSYKVTEMTISILSGLLCTNCDLIILKHLIGEKGQRLPPPTFSLETIKLHILLYI